MNKFIFLFLLIFLVGCTNDRVILVDLPKQSEKSWTFESPAGSSGTFYFGGFYRFASSDNDFSPSTNFGTANTAYAAHFFIVTGETTLDEVIIEVSGTSINDRGVRVENDEQNITIPLGTLADTYMETPKKWLGTVAVETIAGTAITNNYGYSKYWDNNNNDFTVIGFEATWLGGANDNDANITVIHHKPGMWNFNAGGEPVISSSIASMQADYLTESEIKNGQEGAYKRDNLNQFVHGGNGEGTIIEIITSSNKAFEIGNLMLRIES